MTLDRASAVGTEKNNVSASASATRVSPATLAAYEIASRRNAHPCTENAASILRRIALEDRRASPGRARWPGGTLILDLSGAPSWSKRSSPRAGYGVSAAG